MQDMVRTVTDGMTQAENRTAYRTFIKEKIGPLLKQFCLVFGVSACCLDEKGELLTDCFDNPQDKMLWKQIFREMGEKEIWECSCGEDRSEIKITEHVTGRLTAVVPVKTEEQLSLYFIVWADCPDKEQDEAAMIRERFGQSMNLIRDAANAMLQAEFVLCRAREKNRRSRIAELKMHHALRASEATAEIVQLLDCDEQIEEIMDRLLHIMGEYLKIDRARILQVSSDGSRMDIFVDWYKDKTVKECERKQLPPYDFISENHPFLYPADGQEQEQLSARMDLWGIQAIACYPVLKQAGTGCIYLCLEQTKKRTFWKEEEKKFIADSVKILQSILTRRIQKNSLAGSYEALEVVLDNVACAIYVRDKENGKVLFANRRCRNTFSRELQEGTFDSLLDKGVPAGRGSGVYEINHTDRDSWYDLFYTEVS